MRFTDSSNQITNFKDKSLAQDPSVNSPSHRLETQSSIKNIQFGTLRNQSALIMNTVPVQSQPQLVRQTNCEPKLASWYIDLKRLTTPSMTNPVKPTVTISSSPKNIVSTILHNDSSSPIHRGKETSAGPLPSFNYQVIMHSAVIETQTNSRMSNQSNSSFNHLADNSTHIIHNGHEGARNPMQSALSTSSMKENNSGIQHYRFEAPKQVGELRRPNSMDPRSQYNSTGSLVIHGPSISFERTPQELPSSFGNTLTRGAVSPPQELNRYRSASNPLMRPDLRASHPVYVPQVSQNNLSVSTVYNSKAIETCFSHSDHRTSDYQSIKQGAFIYHPSQAQQPDHFKVATRNQGESQFGSYFHHRSSHQVRTPLMQSLVLRR